jgi:hypothetical protein
MQNAECKMQNEERGGAEVGSMAAKGAKVTARQAATESGTARRSRRFTQMKNFKQEQIGTSPTIAPHGGTEATEREQGVFLCALGAVLVQTLLSAAARMKRINFYGILDSPSASICVICGQRSFPFLGWFNFCGKILAKMSDSDRLQDLK